MNTEATGGLPVIYRSAKEKQEAVALIEAGTTLVEKAEKYKTIIADTDAAILIELRARMAGHIKRLDNERLEMGEEARKAQATINADFNTVINPMKAELQRIDDVILAYDKKKKDEAEEARRKREEEERKTREEAEAKQREADEAARVAKEAADKAAQSGSKKAAKAAAQAQEAAEAAKTQAAAAAEEHERAAEVAQLPAPVPPKVITGTYGSRGGAQSNWTWRVVDISQVPEEFLIPAEERVQKATLTAMARSLKGKAKVAGIEFYDKPFVRTREGA